MPAPWLVTRPPMPTNTSVMTAVRQAKRFSQGLSTKRAMSQVTVTGDAINANRCGCNLPQRLRDYDKRLLRLGRVQGEIHLGSAILHFNFLRGGAVQVGLAVNRFHGVFA